MDFRKQVCSRFGTFCDCLTAASVSDISITDTMSKEAVKLSEELMQLLPLTPAVFFVLFALSEGEKHGYAIMREVKQLSDGRVTMGPGTLYTTIQRLLTLEAIEETTEPSEERRRYYRLTRSGFALLKTDLANLDSVLKLAKARNLVPRSVQ